MERAKREKALRLLARKKSDPKITYADIELETGYSKRQLIRLSKRLDQEDVGSVLVHGNSGSRPHNASSEDEVRYLRRLKEPYPNVTIAHFRDIYIEDVIENPAKADDVQRYGLVRRGPTWFRELFAREGWTSARRAPTAMKVGYHHQRPFVAGCIPGPVALDVTASAGQPFRASFSCGGMLFSRGTIEVDPRLTKRKQARAYNL